MELTDIGLVSLLLLEAACLLAYFLKGFSGFGPAMIFIPTVAFIYNPHLALAGSAFIDLFVGLVLLITLKYEKTDWPVIARIAIFLVIGIVGGGGLAGVLPVDVILFIIAVIVVVFGVNLLVFTRSIPKGIEITHPNRLWIGALAGGLAGGLAGISGPFVIMVTRPHMDKSSFRRVMVAVFFVGGVFRLIVYAAVQVWSADVLRLSLLVSPAVIVGLIAGYFSHFTVNEKWFNRVIGLLLLAIAVRIFIKLF